MRRVLVALSLSLVFSVSLAAATFTVDEVGDDGDNNLADNVCAATSDNVCTLRAAIEQANATAGADTIDFNVTGTITLATAYESLVEETDIDATGAPGPVIVDGAGSVAVGFDFDDGTDGSLIAGLEISGFTTAAIHIDGDSVTVRSCAIGPISGGTPNEDGIVIAPTASGVLIGGGGGRNVISGNDGIGLVIEGDDNDVVANYIGTDAAGTAALPNDAGILLTATADGNEIGSFLPDNANVISGNGFDGIAVDEATNTTIFGNLIGLDSTAGAALGNGLDGVGLYGAAGTIVGVSDGGNTISGNGFDGIYSEDATGTIVEGNIIGLDRNETAAVPNLQHGINIDSGDMTIGSTVGRNIISGNAQIGILVGTLDPVTIIGNIIGLDSSDNIAGNDVFGIGVEGGPSDVTIGGTNEGEGNTISGNGFAGISIFFSSGVRIYGNTVGLTFDRTDTRGNGGYGIEMLLSDDITIGSAGGGMNVISGNSASGIDHVSTTGVTITGNRIGTDGTGMTALGNLEAGVEICDATSGVAVSDNLISGNALWGVWLMSDATGNTISNNVIGLNADQSAALANGNAGVLFTDTAEGNTIGPDNVISGNARAGVAAIDTAVDNAIEGNSIFDNGELGIDLGGDFQVPGDGVTPNDDDDTDTGPNGLQNFPVLAAAMFNGSNTSIQGTLNSTPDTTFTVHFYENSVADPSGFGEGQTYLGSRLAITNSDGDAAFIFNGPATTLGNVITATATGPDDGTSEFSGPVTVETAPVVQLSSATYTEAENAGFVTITVTRTGDLSATTNVGFDTTDGAALAGSDYNATTGSVTFEPGEDTATFNVPITNDPTDEPAEDFDVALSNPNGASIGAPSTATVTITDDDDPPQISVDNVTLDEGDAGTTAFGFTVSLSAVSSFTVTVDVETADDSAVEPGDYAAVTTTTLTFDPGETTQPVTVNVNGDTTFEGDEQFFVNLSNESNASILAGQGIGTITDDDGPPLISIDNVTREEGNAGTTALNFSVSLSHPSDAPVTADYETADGTAVAGTDYTAVPTTTLTFDPGETLLQVTVNANGDLTFEGDDTFTVELSDASGGTIDAGKGGTGTIANDDTLPEISIDDVTLGEGDAGITAFVFTVSLSNASDSTVTVNAATANVTAAAGSDYTAVAATPVTFDPGETSQQFTVDVSGDTTFEATETFFVNLAGESGATVDDNQGLGTITNDDAQPEISIDDVTLNEGDAGTTAFVFTVSLSNASDAAITVDAATADDSAIAGSDYTAVATTTLTFDPGETSQQFTVNVSGDTTFESDETFFVDLSAPSGATIEDDQGLGTIADDDGQPSISIDNVALNEGDAGTTPFLFTVSLSHASDTAITVDAATSDGSANAGSDYAAVATTTLTFDPGETSQQFTVNVSGDTTAEGGENFFVDLTSPSGATIADDQGAGIIADDDAALSLTIDDVTLDEGNAGTTSFVFTVTLSTDSNATVTVDAETSTGTATDGSDYTAVATTTLTFDPGETSQQFTVNVSGDTTFEGDETFFVDLTNPSGATVADDQGTGTITNDDGQPAISIDDVTLDEGDAGTTAFVFTVSLSNASDSTITVDAATSTGTATAGDDYAAVATTTLTFDPGETSQQFTVNVSGDTTLEGDETFFVDLSGESGATLSETQGTGTITNDDGLPEISIDDVTLNEGDAGTTAFIFTVTLSNASDSTVTVDAETSTGTATAGSDYAAVATTTLTFDPGETSQQFTVNVSGDTTLEGDETFFADLSGASGASIGDDQGLGTITNDDTQPEISIDDVTLAEGDAGTTAFIFTVSLSNASDSTITVDAATANGSATAGSDYAAVATTTLTFDPGETSQQFTVNVSGDTTLEGTETFFVDLGNPSGATIADDQGTGTITEDDGVPSISIDDVTLNEGDAGTTAFVFTVSLSNDSDSTITVDAATSNGSATAGSDYAAVATTTLTFDPGETSQQFTVNVSGDTTLEGAETFFVDLGNPSGATIADDQGTGTIAEDDGVPSISIDDVTLNEGDTGTTAFVFTVSLSNDSDSTITVDAATSNGTAIAGSDYTAVATTTLTFDPGETSQQFTVDVSGDTTLEGDETFFVDLGNPSGATIADDQGTGTIAEDDGPPSITIDDVTLSEGDTGTTAFVFTVSLSNDSDSPITVDAATSNGTATAGSDYAAVATTTLIFDPGETSQQFTVNVSGDTTLEGAETFFVDLSNSSGPPISDDQGLGTISEDDGVPSISIDDVTLNEGDAGTTAFIFTVSLSNASDSPITVDYSTADGTALAGSDYAAAATTTLTFDPGETSQQVTVNVSGDTTQEGAETFFVNLVNASGATIGDDQGLGTISEDDGPPSISIDDVTLNEGDAGTTAFVFTVSLSNDSDSPVTVDAATSNGTATAGSDYAAVATTTLTFDPGETSQQFTVNVSGDTTLEGTETFFVDLSNSSGPPISDDQGLGTITEDDGVPSISIDDVTLNEGDAGTTSFVFTVSLSNDSDSPITVDAATSNGTAIAGSDYTAVATTTLTFDPGETSQQFTVDVTGDAVTEGDETFFVNLTNPQNAAIGNAQGTGTIVDGDGAPSIIISDVTEVEGDAGTTAFVFTVTLSNESASEVLVDYATADMTAAAGADYIAEATATLPFAPGTTVQTIQVDVLGDTDIEGDEVFLVRLSNAQNATIADDEGSGTIDDDDVLGSANLVLSKTAPSGTFVPGQQLTFTLSVRNDGPDAATNATVTDTLPANTTYVSATSATASCSGTAVVVCTIATLANGATATISLVVNTSGTDDITNTATVAAAEDDANVANNTASVTLAAAPGAPGAAIPTASEWGLLLLAMGLAVAAAMRARG